MDTSVPAICKKTLECNPAGFAAAYPGGLDDCSTKTKASLSAKYGGDLSSKSSTCTDDEVDECLQKFSSAACQADGSVPPVPCSC